jgi:putative membrane protein
MMAGFGLIWIIILGAVLYLIVVLLRKSPGSGQDAPSQPGDSAEAVLRERFARGEIDRDEYENRLSELRR